MTEVKESNTIEPEVMRTVQTIQRAGAQEISVLVDRTQQEYWLLQETG
jgi:hypothetical protein